MATLGHEQRNLVACALLPVLDRFWTLDIIIDITSMPLSKVAVAEVPPLATGWAPPMHLLYKSV